ncbi:MAG: AAA family ATPase [Sporichthyaceae bacterium]
MERETALACLAEYAEDASRREGRLVLVAGEPGVGKTALLERFEHDLGEATWAWGACDGLFTPRPLGPLFDIARQIEGPLLAACDNGGTREELFGTLLRQLAAADRTSVVVVEDVHWADEATLDLLRFLGRRLRDVPALLLVTYRDDGLAADDRLRMVLGDLARQRSTRRMTVPPLSLAAVEEMARTTTVEAQELYRLSGGNPFFVSELLQSQDGELPSSARDAVLARVARLAGEQRRVLEAAALLGTRVDPSLLHLVASDVDSGLEACLATGLLTEDSGGLRFRHELSRRAIEEAVPAHRRTTVHAGLLRALRSNRSDDDARMAHHAEGAGDGSAVLEHAPRAARKATALASHREAVAQYQRALRFADGVSPGSRAELLDELALSLSMVDRWEEAAEAGHAALPLWQAAGEPLREGNTLRMLSRALWRLCRGEESVAAAEEAMAVLTPLPPSPELAAAMANLAGGRMVAGEHAEALELAQRARMLAEQLELEDVISDALNTEGCAVENAGGAGLPLLRRALEVALAAGKQVQASRAYSNLYGVCMGTRRFAEVERCFVEGLDYLDEHDMVTFANCLRGQRAMALERTGSWQEALEICAGLLALPAVSPINRLTSLIVTGTIQVRRGESRAWDVLEQAVSSADRTREPQWIAATRLARVEAAWLEDRDDLARADALRLAEVAGHCDPWVQGATAMWLQRVGLPEVSPSWLDVNDLPAPYALGLKGDGSGAATAWAELGCRYEAALALVDTDDEESLREALACFDDLGATATARWTRRRMRGLGVKAVPAGPRSTTRAHRFGLTRREQEVLQLMCAGLANTEISQRLFISERTVDHHVSAVLAKMGVRSRLLAAHEALRLGLVSAAASGE